MAKVAKVARVARWLLEIKGLRFLFFLFLGLDLGNVSLIMMMTMDPERSLLELQRHNFHG